MPLILMLIGSGVVPVSIAEQHEGVSAPWCCPNGEVVDFSVPVEILPLQWERRNLHS